MEPLESQQWAVIGTMLASMWLMWRIWSFTIVPLLWPDDPKELPYLTPWLGHSIAFFRDSAGLVEYGRKYFGNTKEIYSLTMMGHSVYILTDPEQGDVLFKNTVSFSWKGMVQEIYRRAGFAEASIATLWAPPDPNSSASNQKQNANDRAEQYHFKQLRPGPNLNSLTSDFRDHMDDEIAPETLARQPAFVKAKRGDGYELGLLEWIEHVFFHSVTRIYWGQEFLNQSPNLLRSFREWEATNWKFLYNLPAFLSRDMNKAKADLQSAFTKFLAVPRSNRGNVISFVRGLEDELRDVGLTSEDIGRFSMLQHWGINGNTHKMTFWLVSYLLHNPETMDLVSTELLPMIKDNQLDLDRIDEPHPTFDALWYETLRLHMRSALMRRVDKPTFLGGKLLRPGKDVLMQYQQLHHDEDVWGPDAASWNLRRFLDAKGMERSKSFRPFGGGAHLCPGRFLAKNMCTIFVALLLSRFDIKLTDQQKVKGYPRPDLSKPVLGTLDPAEDLLFIARPLGI